MGNVIKDNIDEYDYMEGYHGTDRHNLIGIKRGNFRVKKDDEEKNWLGNGIYFFISSFGEDPVEKAKKWAIVDSWNKNLNEYTYNEYSVIKCEIIIKENTVLNLVKREHLNIFNYYREQLKERMTEHELRTNNFNDFKIFEHIKKQINSISIIKARIYTMLTAKDRRAKVVSNIPNCTILCVNDNEFIKQKSIEEVEYGRVK